MSAANFDTTDTAVVIDASVWISAFITEDANHDASRPWLDHWLRSHRAIIGPSLVLIEVGGAIARRTDDNDAAYRAIADMRQLPRMTLAPLTDTLATRAATLAIQRRIRGADAIYVALAEYLDIPLVTWDNELLKRTFPTISAYSPATG